MSAKSETPSANSAADAAAPAAGKAPSKLGALLPVILVVVLAPAVSWAVAQFVLLPQLKAELIKALPADAATAAASGAPAHAATPAPAAPSKPEKGDKEGGPSKKGEATGAQHSYTFENIVVNLAGTMGTRYLKTTFMVTGSDPTLRAQFEANRPRMIDLSLNVLSSLTLADLDEPAAKNILREKLGAAYNQALGRKVAEQIYFSDFVVQ
jgi:flagellar FliL protein